MTRATKRKLPQAHHLYLFGLALFLIWRAILFTLHHDIRWDEAVYLTMGKHLLSGGAVGYWETLRPPLWPALLGLYWTMGSAPILGELTSILFGVLGPTLLYLALRKAAGAWVAALTALLLLFSDIWFWYSGQLLTGLPSAALLIASFYLYSKDQHLWAGALAAGAFLTRFPAGLGIAALLASHAVTLWPRKRELLKNKELWRPAAKTVLGFTIPLALWLTTNTIAFSQYGFPRSTLAPLLQGGTTAIFLNDWTYSPDLLFYLKGLLATIPISILAIIGATRLPQHKKLHPYGFLALFALLFFSSIPNQQWRFALLILPGILVLTALGAKSLTERYPRVAAPLIALFILSIGALAIQDHAYLTHRGPQPAPIEEHYWFFAEHPVNGTILVSEPMLAWYAPNPARPIYYEYFRDPALDWDHEYAAIAFTPRSLPCPPRNQTCHEERQQRLEQIIEDYALVSIVTWREEPHYIFSNQFAVEPLPTEEVLAAFNAS